MTSPNPDEEKGAKGHILHLLFAVALILASPFVVFERLGVIKSALESGVYENTSKAGVKFSHLRVLDPDTFRNDIIVESVVVAFFTCAFCVALVVLIRSIRRAIAR